MRKKLTMISSVFTRVKERVNNWIKRLQIKEYGKSLNLIGSVGLFDRFIGCRGEDRFID